MESQQDRITQLEVENGQLKKANTRLELEKEELKWQRDKLYENLERFLTDKTVGNYYK